MPITCEWYDKDANIIISRFGEQWTREEYVDSVTALLELARQVDGRYDIITHFSEKVSSVPSGSLDIWLSDAEQRNVEFPNWGLTVWVASDSTIKAYFDAGKGLSATIAKHVKRAKTIEEAVQLIMDDRQVKT